MAEDAGPTYEVIDGGSLPPFDARYVYDAAPLFVACDTASASSCPSGWTCYGEHTPASWDLYDGGDVFGRCTIVGCTGKANADLCNHLDGTCTCPGLLDGGPGDCAPTDDAGGVPICVPIPYQK